MSIAYQGIAGAWSHLACSAVHPQREAIPCATFEDVFEIVEAGRADLAMIPIENNLGGRVADIHQLLPHQALHIVAEYFQPIRHDLLAVPGANEDQLRAVYSHPQALAQCRRFLRKLGVEPRAASDTAAAAERVAQRGDPTVGAIASRLAGELYQLASLRSDIQDGHHNTTRFIVLAREKNSGPAEADTDYITALWFQLRSVPAALYKALGAFATNKVNLTKLESYIGTENFDRARFYVEVEGHESDAPVLSALEEIEYYTGIVRVLGSFAQHEFRNRGKTP
ncbi:MAG: prephenate dehydratase [Gammaproteobacteria bacterium]|nr:prephenate dehydratase [Gammaproteobacteria bacterium]MYD02927.1 prephenate dehydratase [Gammaproteobacteria bacterium]MYI26020.1 prephenate dehydratase [Gammaproteobacteria bacterium]